MGWLAIVLLASIAIALLRGGRFLNLSEITLRSWPLLLLGFAMQSGANWLPGDRSWAHNWAVALIILSYIPLLTVVWLNRNEPGILLAGIGMFMNFAVIAFNSGMPVLPEAVAISLGKEVGEIAFDQMPKHVLLTDATRLSFLADVIPLRPIRSVISLGDVFLAVGLGQFLDHQLRRPVRWFRHGLNEGKAGSAASR